MSKALVRVFVVAGLLTSATGCAFTGPTHQTWSLFRPDPNDYRDTSEESNDQWAFVGIEGRGDRPLEKENDPFKPFLMSEKARSIERNLGID